MKIIAVIGTRPTFIELAPIINELRKTDCELVICNTGQHYDREMASIFLDQLHIDNVEHNLEVGSGSHAMQTARILTRFERVLESEMPDLVLVEGDTTSAFAAALAAVKLKIKVAHVEAGCRNYDRKLPEEVNRVLISHMADEHFPPTLNCKLNLIKEGIPEDSIRAVGHPILDSIKSVSSLIDSANKLTELGLQKKTFVYFTLHRDFNVDDSSRLESILKEMGMLAESMQVIFALHPRTRARIRKFGLLKLLAPFNTLRPVDYITSLSLTKNSFCVVSDSGGLTKESAILGTPCVTLRPDTEWTETTQGLGNQLAFAPGNTISKCFGRIQKDYRRAVVDSSKSRLLFGKPGISRKITKELIDLVAPL